MLSSIQYLNYVLLVIAEMPIYELTGNHTQPLTPRLVTLNELSDKVCMLYENDDEHLL